VRQAQGQGQGINNKHARLGNLNPNFNNGNNKNGQNDKENNENWANNNYNNYN